MILSTIKNDNYQKNWEDVDRATVNNSVFSKINSNP